MTQEEQPVDKPEEPQPAQPPQTEGKAYYSVRQVAEEFGFSRVWIQKLIQMGRIKAHKPTGKHYRIPAAEVERLRGQGLPPQPPPITPADASEIRVDEQHMNRVTAQPKEKKEPEGDEDDGAPWPFNLLFTKGD